MGEAVHWTVFLIVVVIFTYSLDGQYLILHCDDNEICFKMLNLCILSEKLLSGLKDNDTVVRWSAAKGYVIMSAFFVEFIF